jgi:Zn-dependent protease|tara:strand:- start:1264 stop:2184 length:921 start_codon:yes stop_codon:yes gene_type:complete
MARDSRADILEDDLFSKTQPKIHRVHAHHSSDGTIHIDVGNRNTSGLGSMFGVNHRNPVELHKGRLWHFSKEEKEHLLLATGAFTLALGLMRVGGIFSISQFSSSGIWLSILFLSMPVMLISVGPAFVLHEIGHKIIAKKYGCWAEFRADPGGLRFGLGLAALLGVVFMAPGAVMVAGIVTRRQNGHIALAGPVVNLLLFIIGIPLGGLILGLTGADVAGATSYIAEGGINLKPMIYDLVFFWITANLILGAFNMLPFGPLDGAKIKDWNEGVWFAFFSLFIGLTLLMLTGTWNAISISVSIAGLF